MKNKQQSIILAALILSIAICWLPSVANGIPILSGEVDGRDGHRRSDASGDRLRRQMDYLEDETVVVDAPADAYVGSYDEQQPADGNLTLRFGYGGYQQPFPQQYNPYGWNSYGGGQQPYPGYQPPQPAPNYYNNYPGGYPAAPYGPYNYNYPPDYGNSSNSTTTMNPFYNNYGNNYFYPMMNTTTTTTTTTTAVPTTTTSTSTTTRPYGNYYVFNFRDGSNQTDIDDGAYNGGADGQDDGFQFGNR